MSFSLALMIMQYGTQLAMHTEPKDIRLIQIDVS